MIANKKQSVLSVMEVKRPDLCAKTSGGYGLYSVQHQNYPMLLNLTVYLRLNPVHGELVRLWVIIGMRLDMNHYRHLSMLCIKTKHHNLKQCRYIKVNGLINALKNKDWKAFALGYNGKAYAKITMM